MRETVSRTGLQTLTTGIAFDTAALELLAVDMALAGDGSPSGTPRTADEPFAGHANPALRAQLLATEHWSLLATRSTAQSEVLSRITTFLMLVSASIVSLGLIGQATRFGGSFTAFALVLVGVLVVVGALTQMRVGNASMEDLGHVIGMNRLRAGYVDIDPAIGRYLVTSARDDDAGVWQTYNHLVGPRSITQPLASAGAFIIFFNSGLIGAFAALVTVALGAPRLAIGVVAAASSLSFLGLSVSLGYRQYLRIRRRYAARFPSPAPGAVAGC
jgi:hypothetical protein